MEKQTYYRKPNLAPAISLISQMGLDKPQGNYRAHPALSTYRHGRDWSMRQVCRLPGFSLIISENYRRTEPIVYHTKWENYIKISFCLSGRHTMVLDGFGQFEQNGPQAFVVSGPPEMVKMDLVNAGVHNSVVALCLLPEFFRTQLGISVEDLPALLRELVLLPGETPNVFRRLPFTPDLVAATRCILATPAEVRSMPAYAHAKTVELMCMLLHHLSATLTPDPVVTAPRHKSLLYAAHEILTRRYSEALTIERVSREVGLNRMALSCGFRELFGISVHDYLQKTRMERAEELLQDGNNSITWVAEEVGYQDHPCNFSTAFRAYFGYAPKTARSRQG